MALLSASLETAPGYMDAEYYYAGALRLAAGKGFVEPYLWNYLSNPSALPVPAFAYWMPLVSLLAAFGLKLAAPLGFWGARLPFILLAACVPPLAVRLAFCLHRQTFAARLSGAFALFPAFYFAYLTTTDSFPIYMVLGSLFLLLAFEPSLALLLRMFALGLLAGVLHLTRADGLVWLLAALAVGLWWLRHLQVKNQLFKAVRLGLTVIAGYGLVMTPWYFRNYHVWGSLFPPGGSRTLWLTTYEQTMLYPAEQLSIHNWLAVGWGLHLQAWWSALLTNLQTTLAVQAGIILFPFILIGLWRLRSRPQVKLAAAMWLLNLGVMTFVFPFAGPNGAFFHSGAALQPFWWAAAPLGMQIFVDWLAHLRKWQRAAQVVRFMAVLLVTVSGLLSLGIYLQKVVGSQSGTLAWTSTVDHYRQVEAVLQSFGAQPEQSVLVNNPPGYYLVSGRSALVIPDGDEEMLLAAARQFQARYLVLEITNPWMLLDLYLGQSQRPELTYLTSIGTTRLYRIDLSYGER